MKRTEDQLAHVANIVADIVANTPVEQRHELYDAIALKLQQRLQGFQASHFIGLARVERGGK